MSFSPAGKPIFDRKMILSFLILVTGSYGINLLNEIVRGKSYEISKKYEQEKIITQPRFNTNCDTESLNAARECEERALQFDYFDFSFHVIYCD